MPEEKKVANAFENHPLAAAILREGLLIQDRFAAAPVYARTGKGYLKSVGVSEMEKSKKASPKNQK